MKDKRQRLALAWPYWDSALAATLLHAAHPAPTPLLHPLTPPPHLAPHLTTAAPTPLLASHDPRPPPLTSVAPSIPRPCLASLARPPVCLWEGGRSQSDVGGKSVLTPSSSVRPSTVSPPTSAAHAFGHSQMSPEQRT
ncbi:uncharacterized protein LOC134773943 [Penaeus indicus]|uniref:uncharacterized protein LOC134773943 n=1 Tax=Penaeus indicus TaxID=29960 RepID=UPI00300C9040